MAMPQRDDTIETIKRLDDLLGYAVMHGDKIETGFKHDEYREVKPFWDKHFAGRKGKELRSVTFMRGQASPVQATWEVLNVETAKSPGRTGYYIIQLGKRIK